MAILNGTDLKVSVAGTVVDDLTSVTDSWSMETRDITTKDSAGHRELGSGKDSFSVSAEGMVDPSSTTDYDVLRIAAKAKTAVALIANSGAVAPDYTYAYSAFVTALSRTGGVEDNQTFSVSFEVTGNSTDTLQT